MKTLTLIPRNLKPQRVATWHDFYILSAGLREIIKGKDILKAAPWLLLASSLDLAGQAVELEKFSKIVEDGKEITVQKLEAEVKLELKDHEASLLWREFSRLQVDVFSGGAKGFPVHTFAAFLVDLARQLGGTLPGWDDKEEPEPDSES